jgi:hypothetical protein
LLAAAPPAQLTSMKKVTPKKRAAAARPESIESEKLTRKDRKLRAHPSPERRLTNRFRESHADEASGGNAR